jgi:hypothetical protein
VLVVVVAVTGSSGGLIAEAPAYRVYLWRPVGSAWWSREFEIAHADVVAVIAWAKEHAAADETFTLFALVDSRGERGLVHLAGVDPTRPASA